MIRALEGQPGLLPRRTDAGADSSDTLREYGTPCGAGGQTQQQDGKGDDDAPSIDNFHIEPRPVASATMGAKRPPP
jgi:hypothetical protein